MAPSDTIYTAQLRYWSRNVGRGKQWTTKRTNEIVTKLGFTPNGMYDDLPNNQLWQVVTFSGTREQVITNRTSLTRALKVHNRHIIIVFKAVEGQVTFPPRLLSVNWSAS